ncbi:hypothetical protein AVDCRST_MAG84-2305 [uncultured Microcoleus sp.]|uniref:Uncharacterized protein n=1 Tax=uncultured Microcoleus sp. TaxID=259945 RepID=A0A6J4LRH1_9CYAN|nr:hypothetical protein AVDCRST_MAG84-2305 [uncultured Microcoleus sp.]
MEVFFLLLTSFPDIIMTYNLVASSLKNFKTYCLSIFV